MFNKSKGFIILAIERTWEGRGKIILLVQNGPFSGIAICSLLLKMVLLISLLNVFLYSPLFVYYAAFLLYLPFTWPGAQPRYPSGSIHPRHGLRGNCEETDCSAEGAQPEVHRPGGPGVDQRGPLHRGEGSTLPCLHCSYGFVSFCFYFFFPFFLTITLFCRNKRSLFVLAS